MEAWSIGTEAEVTASLTGDDCAIFGYDVNADGLIDNTERMGFRYDATDKAVEMRKGGTDCSGSGWEVTDEDAVEIDTFTITDQSPGEDAVEIDTFTITDQSPGVISAGNFDVNIREYSIEMTGHLKSDPSFERSLRETIRVRNDSVS